MKNSESERNLFSPDLLKGLNVVVTGAGRGIGAAVAYHFLGHGANLFAHLGSRSGNASMHTFDHNPGEGNCHIAYGDLSKPTDIAAISGRIIDNFPHVDVLVRALSPGQRLECPFGSIVDDIFIAAPEKG